MSSRAALLGKARALIAHPAATATRADGRAMLTSATWRELVVDRGWVRPTEFAAAPANAQEAVVLLLSSALTYPLSLAAACHALAPPTDGGTIDVDRHVGHGMRRLCVVGSRAEAALPAHFWAELGHFGPECAKPLTLTMTGLADAPAPGPTPAAPHQQAVVIEQAPRRQPFHKTPLGAALLQADPPAESAQFAEEFAELPDAFVLFNPGRATYLSNLLNHRRSSWPSRLQPIP